MAKSTSSTGIIVIDHHERIVHINQPACVLLNLSTDDLHMPIRDRLPPQLHPLIATDQHIIYEGDLHLETTSLPAEQRLLMAWPVSQRAKRLSLLNEIIRISTANMDVNTLLEALADSAAHIIGGDGCYITFWDATTRRTIPKAAYGPLRDAYPQRGVKPSQKTLTQAVIEAGQPLAVNDVFNSPHLDPAIAAQYPAQSALALPLRVEGRNLGALIIAFNTQHTFADDEIHWAEQAADLIALAIAKTEALDDLRERNTQLDAYAHTVAHDLKGPLSLIMGYMDIFDSFELDLTEEERALAYRHIRQAAFDMEEIINGLLLLAHLRRGEPIEDSVNLKTVIQNLTRRYEPELYARRITFTTSAEPMHIIGHTTWVEGIIANLLSNAIKYIGLENPSPRIDITCEPCDEAYICISVSDNGLGIPEEKQAELLDDFKRIHTDQADGHGLGLSIVVRTVAALNGTFSFESTPGQGSTFHVKLPRA